EFAPSAELGDQLRRHENDEHKHELLLGKAVRSLGQPVVELPRAEVFNVVVRWFTPGTFHIVAADPPDVRREKLANFLAHAHFLEKRVAHSMGYHLDACAGAASPVVPKMVAAVLRDEDRHVTYTLDAVTDLLPRHRAVTVLQTHRRAEAKANLRFSRDRMRTFLACHTAETPRYRRRLYRILSVFLEGADRLVEPNGSRGARMQPPEP